MKIELRQTADGSPTLYSEYFDQHYHSVFGAKQESDKVFIELGLLPLFEKKDSIRIFEMGFGTGLNAWLTAKIALKNQKQIDYTGIEAYPIGIEMAAEIDKTLGTSSSPTRLIDLHTSPWQQAVAINDYFTLTKLNGRLEDYLPNSLFDLIYFDAFAPETQPELWTIDIFKQLNALLTTDGVLTTYCSKVAVQRNMKEAGFGVEKHPGPPHKREVIRAIKL